MHTYSWNVHTHISCRYVHGTCNIYLYFNLLPLLFCALLHLRRNITWQKLGSKELIVSVLSLEWNVSFSYPLFPFSFKLDGRNSPSRFSLSAILLVKICLETRFLHMKMCVLISPFCVSLFLSQVWRVIWGHRMSVLKKGLRDWECHDHLKNFLQGWELFCWQHVIRNI